MVCPAGSRFNSNLAGDPISGIAEHENACTRPNPKSRSGAPDDRLEQPAHDLFLPFHIGAGLATPGGAAIPAAVDAA
jgi:hypothetical protein